VSKLQSENKESAGRELVGTFFQTDFLFFFAKKKGEKGWSARCVNVLSPKSRKSCSWSIEVSIASTAGVDWSPTRMGKKGTGWKRIEWVINGEPWRNS
jgi:hypothetical protein